MDVTEVFRFFRSINVHINSGNVTRRKNSAHVNEQVFPVVSDLYSEGDHFISMSIKDYRDSGCLWYIFINAIECRDATLNLDKTFTLQIAFKSLFI
jgi:hypothetical protein